MATAATAPQDGLPASPDAIVVHFAGDSGDGMQLTGGQFTLSTALAGNDLATFFITIAPGRAQGLGYSQQVS
mgnify:CR=1 FL=1